jgi:DNA transposition AAA+ family ATPase
MTTINKSKFPILNGHPATFEDIKKRKEQVKKIIINHPKYKAIYDRIRETHLLSVGSTQPDGVFLSGLTGVGKSTLLKDYAESYPRKRINGNSIVPILYFKVPVGATPKSVASQALYELADPNFDRGTQVQLTARLLNFVRACKVEMIMIDEIQHLIDREKLYILNNASDWVKTFVEDAGIPVVICGMPESRKIFEWNTQVDRRFCTRHTFEAFNYSTKEDQIEFRAFLKGVDKELPFAGTSNLADPQISEKFYYATNGVPFFIMKILEEATIWAAKNGSDKLSEIDLQMGYKAVTISQRPHAKNPFNDPKFNLRDAIDSENRARQRHGKRNK